jgi:pyruvate dehydrogenase E1 component alpha subunit
MDTSVEIPVPDSWHLFEQMYRCRLFEEEVKHMWLEGIIPGEMHMSMGEEGIVAGIVDQLGEGDALALDHRGTAPLLVRGVDPVILLKELMGKPDGLCRGYGGHMHLYSPELLAASSGIVGSSGAAAVGFALANQRLRPGKISVAFFGEGAANQGAIMEAFNLASIWKLPVMFVCKDDSTSILTQTSKVTGGDLVERAASFGLRTAEVDGSDVEEVWRAANREIGLLRNGDGPVFLYATCIHIEGHFLGDPLLRYARPSISQTLKMAVPLVKAHTQSKGAPLKERTAGLKEMLGLIWENAGRLRSIEGDRVLILRKRLTAWDEEKVVEIERDLHSEIEKIAQQAAIIAGEKGGQEA